MIIRRLLFLAAPIGKRKTARNPPLFSLFFLFLASDKRRETARKASNTQMAPRSTPCGL